VAEHDPRYLEGIEHFNKCDFFEAHEVWEELWADYSGPSRKFYQGLIQVAVCLHHFGNGNIRGAKKLYFGCRGYLEPYLPKHEGLDLTKLLGQLEICCREILESKEEFPRIAIVPDLIPEIHLEE
jgi:predicted metal-dependent hydrolase